MKRDVKANRHHQCYRAVIFDLDGTLVDTNDLHASSWKEALFDRGYYVPFAAIRSLIGMGSDKLIPALTPLSADDQEARELAASQKHIFLSRHLPGAKPFPHARTLVKRMKEENLKILIATSSEHEVRESVLTASGLADLIDVVIGSGDGIASTPSPDVVINALKFAALQPEHAVLIGDTRFDIEAARGAGVDAIALLCGGAPEKDLQLALAVYDDPMDLLENYATSPLG